jgi:hypothetical protein
MMKKVFSVGAAAVMSTTAFLLTPAASASAATVTAAANQPAPVCIEGKLSIDKGDVTWLYSLRVENHCTGTFTVKAVIVHHSDSKCHTLARGQYFVYDWTSFVNYAPLEGIVLC